MSEHIIDMGDSSYKSSSGLLCADVSQLREEIVRCRDCVRYSLDDYGNTWCAYVASAVQPDDFCAWGRKVVGKGDHPSECEMYVVSAGYQCGNCGKVFETIPISCSCGARVVSIVDEGESFDE